MVEQAVYRGIKSMEPGASRTPVIRITHHSWKQLPTPNWTRIFNQFIWAPPSSSNAAERRKLNEVSKGLESPPSCFIPTALDNLGTWSDVMLNYFVEAAANGQSILPPGTLLHRARILSSLATYAANSLYLQHERYGRNSES